MLEIAREKTLDDVDRFGETFMPFADAGQPPPMTCSFRRSPEPSPSVKRLLLSNAIVAAAWATIAGW